MIDRANGHGMPNTEPRSILLTARDAAKALAVSERTLCRLTQRGEIRVVHLGGGRSIRYSMVELERFASGTSAAGT